MIERDHIGIFGKMNSGKSTLMNLLTQQETSIVDPTPGTTSDIKAALCEIHGIGPVKIFDTAGLDEDSFLGGKKKRKALATLKECDLVLLIIDPGRLDVGAEIELLELARSMDKQVLILFNLFEEPDRENIKRLYDEIELLKFYNPLTILANDIQEREILLNFILEEYRPKRSSMELLPFVEKGENYILVIPMDEETPQGRFLRPQQMAVECITRKFAYPSCFRIDLNRARNRSGAEGEKRRFLDYLEMFGRKPRAIVTDSQAMDILSKWCPEDVALTTFSITMIQYLSRGKLSEFAHGLSQIRYLEPGDKVLIVEACNHSRICEDIGTVQIPKFFYQHFPGVVLGHCFGREFQDSEDLCGYKLVIHCGGCMISPQKLNARIRDLKAVGIPYTNYGLFLSYLQGDKALGKVLQPWGLEMEPELICA